MWPFAIKRLETHNLRAAQTKNPPLLGSVLEFKLRRHWKGSATYRRDSAEMSHKILTSRLLHRALRWSWRQKVPPKCPNISTTLHGVTYQKAASFITIDVITSNFYVCMYVCVCVYVRMYVRIYIYMCVCMYVCMCIYIYMYVRVYIYIYIRGLLEKYPTVFFYANTWWIII